MERRVRVEPEVVAAALDNVRWGLSRRLGKHGPLGFIGPHEALGILAEEYDELRDAVRANDPDAVRRELLDIAVGAVFGLASMYLYELPAPAAPRGGG